MEETRERERRKALQGLLNRCHISEKKSRKKGGERKKRGGEWRVQTKTGLGATNAEWEICSVTYVLSRIRPFSGTQRTGETVLQTIGYAHAERQGGRRHAGKYHQWNRKI